MLFSAQLAKLIPSFVPIAACHYATQYGMLLPEALSSALHRIHMVFATQRRSQSVE